MRAAARLRLNVAKPFHAVYYSDNAVSPKIRVFVDFLAERLGGQKED